MSDNQTNQQDSSGLTFGSPVTQDTPVKNDELTFGPAVKQDTAVGQDGRPALSPEEQASQTRQMAVSGLTGMPTPNMTAEDKAQFEQGKAAGAISVPAVAAGTVAATYAPEIAHAVLKHVQEPGVVFKFPYGRAIEYYMMGKLGLSKGAVGQIAKHLPLE